MYVADATTQVREAPKRIRTASPPAPSGTSTNCHATTVSPEYMWPRLWVKVGVRATDAVQVGLTRVRARTGALRQEQRCMVEAPALAQQRIEIWNDGRVSQHLLEGAGVLARKAEDAVLCPSGVASFCAWAYIRVAVAANLAIDGSVGLIALLFGKHPRNDNVTVHVKPVIRAHSVQANCG
jgi:hypothetical protein